MNSGLATCSEAAQYWWPDSVLCMSHSNNNFQQFTRVDLASFGPQFISLGGCEGTTSTQAAPTVTYLQSSSRGDAAPVIIMS